MSTSEPLILSTGIAGSDAVEVYINMYFSEVAKLEEATEKREFVLAIDNKIASTEPIVPPYGGVLQLSLFNTSASSKTTSLWLPPTPLLCLLSSTPWKFSPLLVP